MGISYHIYANTGIGDPINYSVPIGTTTGLSFSPPALNPSSTYLFGVRAFDDVTLYEEMNVDAFVTIITDAGGNDITARPAAPQNLTATPVKGAGIRLDWTYPYVVGTVAAPTGFHVYTGTSGTPNYGVIVATVTYTKGLAHYTVTLTGLSDGATYAIGVRAFNLTAEEPNTVVVLATADGAAPKSVANLAGFPVSQPF